MCVRIIQYQKGKQIPQKSMTDIEVCKPQLTIISIAITENSKLGVEP